MKLIRTLLAFLAITFAALPAKAYWHSDWPGSWLIGVSGGYGVREGRLDVQFDYAGLPALPTTTVLRHLSDPGFLFGLFAGYQATCGPWLLGIEADVQWHDIEKDHAFAFSDSSSLIGWNGSSYYKSPIAYGLSGRIGFAWVGYFMPYLRLGAEISRDELQSTFTANPAVIAITLSLQDKKWIHRFLLGAGLEFPLPCVPLTVRLEYVFHSKGKTLETNSAFFDGLVNPNFDSDIQPQTKSVMASLVWNIF